MSSTHFMHDCTNGYGFIQVIAVAQRTCNTGSDCNSDECCVSNNPPRGKRFLETHSHLGHCVPMGTDGSSKFFLCSELRNLLLLANTQYTTAFLYTSISERQTLLKAILC